MEKINIRAALEDIFSNVPTNNVDDETIMGYMVVLRNKNGALIDKQPILRLFDMVFNYCMTDKIEDLSKKMLNAFDDIENEGENENGN